MKDTILAELMEIIQEITEDSSVPRNVKKTLTDIRTSLESDSEGFKLKVDAAIQEIEELSLNPNMPAHVRPHIWNISSVLEDLGQL